MKVSDSVRYGTVGVEMGWMDVWVGDVRELVSSDGKRALCEGGSRADEVIFDVGARGCC